MSSQNGGSYVFCTTPFWDANVTWYTSTPDLTPCFQNTILPLVPCGFLWLGAVVSEVTSRPRSNEALPYSLLNIGKLVLSLLLVAVTVVKISNVARASVESDNVPVSEIMSPAVTLFTFLFVLWLQNRHRRKGMRSSSLLFFFWVLLSTCGVLTYQSVLMSISTQEPENLGDLHFILAMLYYPAVLSQLVLSAFNESPAHHMETRRISEEPILSKITFSYIESLVYYGLKNTLSLENLVPLRSCLNSQYSWKKFASSFLLQEPLTDGLDPTSVVTRRRSSIQVSTKMQYQPKTSVTWALCKAFWPSVGIAFFLELLFDILKFVSPIIMSQLIDFASSDEPVWKGYFYAFCLFLCTCLANLAAVQTIFFLFTSGLQTRSALVSAIFRKSLKLSSSSRRLFSLGEIVNFMAIDAERLLHLITAINIIWSAPLRIILSLFLLWQYLGPSCLAGLAVMLLMMPITGILAHCSRNVQKKQMTEKDERVKKLSDILNGIRVLKMYAWELPFLDLVTNIRDKEMKLLRKFSLLNATLYFFWVCTPSLITVVTFITYVMVDVNNILDPSTAFVSLTLFNMLKSSMATIPSFISSLIQTSVSLKRLNKFFYCEELDPDCVEKTVRKGEAVSLERAAFSWEREEPDILTELSLCVPRGRLIAVVGRVGCGKSSLLSAILGEMYKTRGRVKAKGSLAYVPQQAWIQNATLRQNILFLRPYDNQLYQKILDWCCLGPDIEVLPVGDLTEIGERGINLSGGQKQRVSLARAVYQDADLYLLDDPLSAVDSHVGKLLFKQVIGPQGALRHKTRILVTHSMSVLPEVDIIFVMTHGKVSDVGTYQELLERGTLSLSNVKNSEFDSEADSPEDDDMEQSDSIGSLERLNSEDSSKSKSVCTPEILLRSKSWIKEKKPLNKEGATIMNKEKMEEGNVKSSVYLKYLKSAGALYTISCVVGFIVFQGFEVASSIWLSEWSEDKPHPDGSQDVILRNKRIAVYTLFGLISALFLLIGNIAMALGAMKASCKLHREMLLSVLRCPMQFFDTTPLGRLLNRFGKDISIVDSQIPELMNACITLVVGVFGALIVICISLPVFVAILIPIVASYYFLQKLYLITSRQVKRLESITRSPIYSQFSESLQGASSLRAYKAEDAFAEVSDTDMNKNTQCFFQMVLLNRWIAVRLDFMTCVIILAASLLSVAGKGYIEAGTVGLVLTYVLKITDILNVLARRTNNLEVRFVSVERVNEYCRLPSEAPWTVDMKLDPSWPARGAISFVGYKTRYRKGLDLVLKGINLNILSNEKIGVVGRTGSGKTSLTLGLFRMIEPAEGSILIDGVDISSIGLHNLRSNLAIIPQDPVLFEGSLRMNIDPNNKYSDNEIWTVLECAYLKEYVSSLPQMLNHAVAEGGENLSVGQRQLLCLARALLKKAKILVLDEATASVDMETDRLIQTTIRSEFADCTVITIAHRINTIMDSDRVIVVEDGNVVEQGPPEELLNDADSSFYSMARDAGIV